MQKLNRIMRVLFSALAGAVAAIGVIVLAGRYGDVTGTEITLLKMLLWLVPALVLGVFLHEVGHVVGGRLAGMRPLVLVVGPLTLEFAETGRVRGMVWHTPVAGGLAVCAPKAGGALKPQLLGLVSGGPLMSLVLAGLTWPLAFSVGGELGVGLFICAGVHAMVFLMTAMPAQAAGLATDGARFFGLVRNTAAGRHFIRTFERSALLFGRAPPAEWPVDEAMLAATIEDTPTGGTERLAAECMLMWRLLDTGDLPGARARLQHVEAALPADMPAPLKSGFLIELAVMHLFLLGDKAGAVVLREGADRGLLQDPHMVPLYEGMLAALEGDTHARDDAFDRARGLIPRSLSKSIAAMHERLMVRTVTQGLPLGAD